MNLRRCVRSLTLLAVLGIPLAALKAQQLTLSLTVNEVMSTQELESTGVLSLSPSQRTALNKWLNRYTSAVVQVAHGSANRSNYGSIGGGHWVSEKADSGGLMILEDGSIWEISPTDRVDTMLWLPTTDITVLESKILVGGYKYLLINTDDGEKAEAKYLGSK
jgi:hypothetical protein